MFYKLYDNKAEIESTLERHKNGHHVFEMVKNIHIVFGKKMVEGKIRDKSTPPVPGVPFKK
jgi:hypothetical protein